MKTNTIGRPLEILMVEDSLTFARITMGALRNGRIDHRLTWLRDGGEALQFLYKRGRFGLAPRPDLILLDLGLPGTDDRDVLDEVKSQPELASIPLVVLTSSTDEADRIRCEAQSVEAYLNKPVDLDKFLWLVRRLKRYWQDEELLSTLDAIERTQPVV